ncbi:hypothetical protein FSARC_1801 [Fusarium sarcochroum]|uniref:Uncharacterized protein n=1 Tax=Fusarium sarcochroum TaxID=1208366 RepID=A0A8H4U8A5_9HYPO|nr:hypothetical protein FSARC_1801 [Fusarium sarcochroum]
MFMRNVFIAAVSLQALVEGVLAQDKVTLTKTVTKKKQSSTAQGYDEVTVIPTSYVTDGTTLWVDETVTIPCSKCTATSTDGDVDAEATSEVVIETVTSTLATDSGSVVDQTAEVTVVPTSYVTDGTTIWVDETITIPCSKCEATSTASTAGDADAEATSEATTEADAETTAVASDSGFITEQTADITTVVPTSYITRGTTRFVNETITIPCTKCAAKTKTPASEAAEETTLDTSAAVETTGATQAGAETSAETSASTEEETTAATQDAEETTEVENGTQTANTATDEAEASTEAETPIPTTINLSTGYGENTVTSRGPFANTTAPAGADTTAVDENPSAVTSEAATSSAVVSKVNKPVIIVIREVTIFHRTVVIGAACPPVKAGNGGKYIVGTGSDEKAFTEVGEALSDACSKQFKACSANAGKDISVDDCQKQLTICLSDASSTAKAPTPITKESTETASIIVPSDAAVTGETKSYVGGNVVISTRTLTVSESCVISDGTPVVEGPTETGAETTETGAAETNVSSALAGETTEAAEPTETEAATGSETDAVESSEAVTIVTLTKSDGEVSTTALTLTNGVPTGTGSVPSGGETEVESSADTVPTTEVVVDTTAAAETTAAGETEVSSALGGETTEAGETVTGTATGVVIITMTKSDGEVSTTAVTLTNGVPTGTGAVPPPNGDATTVEAPAETSESAIGQDTTLPVGDKTVTKTVTNKVTETVTVGKDTVSVGVETVTNQVTETVTVPCGANGQTANVVTSVVTACPAPTTLATTPVRTPETVYVTATVEAARLQSAEPAPQRFRRMLGLAW